MTIERPMFPPRADSVHAFPAHPAIGQPESHALTGESAKPAKGPSRRHLLAGLAVLPAAVSAVAAAPVLDAALTELVGKFELLLGEYYARRADWGPRLAQAHAETDELFGVPWEAENMEARCRFFSEATDRLDVDKAHDRMHAVGEEMKPLARAIVALPATSIEVLRARALVAFWQVAPLSCGDTTYDFDNEIQFQMLFSAVMEFCRLTHKIATTGYTLPEMPDFFSPCVDDEEAA